MRAIRMGKGYTVTEAAFHAGFSAQYLTAMESGVHPISDAVLVKCSRGWKRKFDWMVETVRGNGAAR